MPQVSYWWICLCCVESDPAWIRNPHMWISPPKSTYVDPGFTRSQIHAAWIPPSSKSKSEHEPASKSQRHQPPASLQLQPDQQDQETASQQVPPSQEAQARADQQVSKR